MATKYAVYWTQVRNGIARVLRHGRPLAERVKCLGSVRSETKANCVAVIRAPLSGAALLPEISS